MEERTRTHHINKITVMLSIKKLQSWNRDTSTDIEIRPAFL